MSYARVTPVQVPVEGIEPGIDAFRSQVLQTARSLPGYKGASLLVDRATGKGIGMTFWDTEDARSSADEKMNAVRAETLKAMGVDPASIPAPEMYEVAVDDYNV